MYSILLSALIGATAFRVRGDRFLGDWLEHNMLSRKAATELGRLVCAAAFGFTLSISTGIWLWSFAAALAFFGTLHQSHSFLNDIGKPENQNPKFMQYRMAFYDTCVMLIPVQVFMVLPGLLFNYEILLPFTRTALAIIPVLFLAPLIFNLAWKIPSRIPRLNQGIELGEALFGALLFGMVAV